MPSLYDYFSVNSTLTCKEIKDVIKPELLRRRNNSTITPEFTEMRGILVNVPQRAEYDQYRLTSEESETVEQELVNFNQYLINFLGGQLSDFDSDEALAADSVGEDEWGGELFFGEIDIEVVSKPEGKEEAKRKVKAEGRAAEADADPGLALAPYQSEDEWGGELFFGEIDIEGGSKPEGKEEATGTADEADPGLALVPYQPEAWGKIEQRWRSLSDASEHLSQSYSPIELDAECESRLKTLLSRLQLIDWIKVSFDWGQLIGPLLEEIKDSSMVLFFDINEAEKDQFILKLMAERLPESLNRRLADMAGPVFADLKENNFYYLFDNTALQHGEKLKLGFVLQQIALNARIQGVKWHVVVGTNCNFATYISNHVTAFLTSELGQSFGLTDAEVDIVTTALCQAARLKQPYEEMVCKVQGEISMQFEIAEARIVSTNWGDVLKRGCNLNEFMVELVGEVDVSRLNELGQLGGLTKRLEHCLVDFLYPQFVEEDLNHYFKSSSPKGCAPKLRLFDHRRLSGSFETILFSSCGVFEDSPLYQLVKPVLIGRMRLEYGAKFSRELKSLSQPCAAEGAASVVAM